MRLGEELSSGVGQLDAALGAVEQLHVQLALESPDRLAQRRLGDTHAHGRPAEVQLFAHGDKVAEVPELHDCAS
jgi:hypothetical protein